MADKRGEEKPADPGAVTEAEAEREPFLSRWSRLKQASKEDAPPTDADQAEPVTETAPAGETDRQAEPDEPPGDEEMPPLESLGPDSDYSPFMSPRVSAELRRKALRQMFRSPKFNITDGLEVYAEDYTKFAPLGNVMTADLKFRLERKMKEQLAKITDVNSEAGDEGEMPRTAALDKDTVADPDGAPEPDQHQNTESPEDDDDRNDA
ncbi:MAG: DUF3306 domain-containing protein [Gammaproteobacteria bacterium]